MTEIWRNREGDMSSTFLSLFSLAATSISSCVIPNHAKEDCRVCKDMQHTLKLK